MTIREQLNSIAEKRILILDGAMGSVIQVLNLNEKSFRGEEFAAHPVPLDGCNDLLCLTRPGAIGAIHDTYLEAGADIIETCSFNATSISLSDYGLGHLSYEISMAAARIARKSADKFSVYGKPRFVAGSLGPTARSASICTDITSPGKRGTCWDELEAAYYDSARGLLDGGVDILLVETIIDTVNAKAALFAICRLLKERQIDVPVMISAAISGESGRLLAGQSLEAFCISVLHAKPWSIGLNCSFNAPKLLPHVRLLSEIVPCLVSAYPNAGLPNRFGRYEETPEIMSANIEPYFEKGLVNIIGACCGSTPAHIAAIATKARNGRPREIKGVSLKSYFSGFEPFYTKNSTICIKNTENSAKVDVFSKLFTEGKHEDAADAAQDINEERYAILEIMTDDEKAINSFLDYALINPYVAKTPFLINSSSPEVFKAALKRLQGRSLAGPVSLKDGEEEFVQKTQLIQAYGAAAVVSLIDEQVQAGTFEQKTELIQRIYQLLRKNGCQAESVVFDPSAAGENDPIVSWIRNNCPGVIIAI